MSDSSKDVAQVIASYNTFAQGNYNSAAARVLFIWDYLVTLDREVEFVWGQRFSAASALFVINRYVNLLITILELVEQATFQTPESCVPVVRILQTLLIIATFIVALFATLRVYATWSRDWRPALPVLVLSLVTPAADMYLDISSQPILAPQPSVGCAIRTYVDRDTRSRIVIAERAATIAYDALVLVFTLLKTSKAREVALSLHRQPNLPALLIRDGTTYFLLLFLMNLAQIIVAALVPGFNYITYFVSPLTSILISRFLLNLRQAAQRSHPNTSSANESDPFVISTHFPSINMSTTVLDDMGVSLYADEDAYTEDAPPEERMIYEDEPFLSSLDSDVKTAGVEMRELR